MAIAPNARGRQRIELKLSAPAGKGWQWQLNGRPLAHADSTLRWLPQPGRHRLRLVDAQGSVVDEAGFEVRSLRSKTTR